MTPEFGSPCEDPIAWACPACGFLQLETGGRALTGEQAAEVRDLARPSSRGPASGEREVPAAVRAARDVRAAFGLSTPVDVERVATLLGYPLEWVSRPPHERGGIARQRGREALLLNRDYPFRSMVEQRWVVAEELAHAVLGHSALAASEAPGAPPTLREPDHRRQERAARAFAAELLMPAPEVRTEFARAQPLPRRALGGREREDLLRQVVADLARTFQVSQTAMRIRLEELDLLH
jgi:hypothetical protein